jgi:hypothetical protein
MHGESLMNKSGKVNLPVISFLALAGLAGMALILTAVAKYGPGVTHDSAAYMYAAESLLKDGRFDYFGYPSPFIQWPPLYPALLAAGGFFGLPFGAVSGFINAAAYGLIVFFSGYWMCSRFKSGLVAISGTLLVLVSLPLIMVTKYVWTEALFILFSLLFYINFEKYMKGRKPHSLILAGIFTALACLDRYAGVTLVLAASLFLLFQKKSFFKRVLDVAVYGVIAALPLGIWVVRNYIVSSTLLGVRIPSTYPLALNIRRSVGSVLTWIQPDARLAGRLTPILADVGKLILPVFSAAVVICFAAMLAKGAFKRGKPERPPENEAGVFGSGLLPVTFYIVFSLIYVVYLIASATSVAFEPINSRYLSPVYLPAVFIVFISADFIAGRLAARIRNRTMLNAVAAMVMLLVLAWPALNSAASVYGSMRDGAGGVSSVYWHSNKLASYVKDHPLDGTYYSNSADTVYVLTGVRTYSPPKKSGPYMYGLEQFKKAIERDKNSYVIWFKNGVPDTLYSIEEIGGMYGLELIETDSDGRIYRIMK